MITNLIIGMLIQTAVPHVDFEQYAGKWHEIARLPNRFQAKCVGDVTAAYTLRKDGKIDVLNRCRVKDGSFIEAKGLARKIGKGHPNSELKVRFAPAFLSFLPQVWGDYHILSLAPDYSYAVVGSPDHRYLWILSRSTELPDSTYRRIVEEMGRLGFATDRLTKS
jgi:apolipoprotein D and lipocalin family protein